MTKVAKLISQRDNTNISLGVSEDTIEYVQDDNVIKIPYRIYYIDNSDEYMDSLTEQQKMIIHCIFSRSFDGFVRQKHMNSLLLMDYEDWSIPYIVKICDEYVLEIIEMTYEMLKDKNTEQIKEFCLENKVLFCKSYNRMISYWNEYYKCKYKNFHQYIGRKLFRDCFGYSKSLERRKSRSL